MAVAVKKLEGEDIPAQYRAPGVMEVFRVTDEDGVEHYCVDDVEAAKLAVELSDRDHR